MSENLKGQFRLVIEDESGDMYAVGLTDNQHEKLQEAAVHYVLDGLKNPLSIHGKSFAKLSDMTPPIDA